MPFGQVEYCITTKSAQQIAPRVHLTINPESTKHSTNFSTGAHLPATYWECNKLPKPLGLRDSGRCA